MPRSIPRSAAPRLQRAAVFASACAAALAGCSSKPAPPQPAVAPAVTNRLAIGEQVRRNLGITFAKAESRRVVATLRMPGRFEAVPTARRDYPAPLAGRVELLARQYDAVTTGTPLYRLDSPDWRKLKQEAVEARSRLFETSAALALARAAVAGGGQAMLAGGQRAAAQGRHVESLRQSLALAEARLAQVERIQRLAGGKLAELAEARAKVAEARTAQAQAEEESADIARERLRSAGEPGSVFATSATLAANLATRLAEHEAARLRVSLAASAARSVLGTDAAEFGAAEGEPPAWLAMDEVTVRAAAPGTVRETAATNGATVEAARPVVSVVDPALVRFRAVGLQSDIARLSPGTATRIIQPAGAGADPNGWLTGTLAIGLEADADQRTMDVIVTPAAAAPWARAGVATEAECVLEGSDDPETAIPLEALIQDDLQKIYFRRDPDDPDKAIRTEADLGISDGRWVAVQSGLKAGDEVVVGGVYQLKLAGGGKATEAGHFHADGTFHTGKD